MMRRLNLYIWQGIDSKGEPCSGYQLSTSYQDVELQLISEGIIPYQLKLNENTDAKHGQGGH